METKIKTIDPRKLRLLEQNARYMKQQEYQQLVENIKKDGALSSVPFCCLVVDWEKEEEYYEVLSGNHRVMAAIDAGLKEIQIMYTEEELSESQRMAIILSHNSITGHDDLATLKEMYEQIDDLQYRRYSGLDDETLKLLDKVGTQSMSSLSLEYQLLNIVVLPTELEEAQKIIEEAKKHVGKNTALTLRYEDYDKWLDTLDTVGASYNIKNTATVLLAMLMLVENHLDELKNVWIEEADDKQWVPTSTLLGRTKVRASDGRVIDKAIERMISTKAITKKEKHKALAIMAQSYLDSVKKK